MIIIGSKAIGYWTDAFRPSNDIDIMSTERIENYDCIIVHQEILDLIPEYDGYATLDAIYTIKCSHLGWDIKWQKHKDDVLRLRQLGAKKIQNLYDALVEYWKKENGNKPYLSLYKKKSDFFNDYVAYVYDHDYLHELVAYPNPPVYTKCLRQDEDVAIDKDKFDALPFDQQLRMFKEEISVIAAERWLIPPKVCGKYEWREAYSLALHKTMTALTKNWATDFLIDNLEYFVKADYSYFKHLLSTLKEGEILMAKQVNNWEEIVNEVIEAYNITNPKYPIDENDWAEFVYEMEDFKNFKNLDQEGGGEGEGEYCHYVFQWKDKIYKLVYNYYSYDGLNFDYASMYEVEPKEKTITVYE